MAEHSTHEERARAVGRVLAGESQRKVARESGVSPPTVRRWVAAAERSETAQEKKLAAEAAEIAEDIEERLVEARDKLLSRLVEVTPFAKGVQPLSIAFGVISDKLALARGEPTDRHEHLTQTDFDREVAELSAQVAGNHSIGKTNGKAPASAGR